MAKDLKKTIRNAYESETPDLRERIISACENQPQYPAPSRAVKTKNSPSFFRRMVAVMSCVILFGVGLFVGRILPQSTPTVNAETCVYLDVNPSLALSLDKENTVLSCVAANEDAESVLNGMKLEGVELKTALNAIVGSMYVKGYLSSDDNSMLISVDTADGMNTSDFLTYITNQVNAVFANSQMQCAILAQGVKADENLKNRAEEQGVSVGKMHLLDKMINSMDSLTQEDISELSEMSIKDLNLLYSHKKDEEHKPDDEVVSGTVNVDVTANEALNIVLTEMGKDRNDVEEYGIHILPSKHGGMKVVYTVTIKLYNNETVYKYEVNCRTGEIRADGNDDSFNQPPQENDGDDFPPGEMPGGGVHDGR